MPSPPTISRPLCVRNERGRLRQVQRKESCKERRQHSSLLIPDVLSGAGEEDVVAKTLRQRASLVGILNVYQLDSYSRILGALREKNGREAENEKREDLGEGSVEE